MGAMYEPQNNGPHTLLAATINDSQTSITVADATILPAAPNVLTIGTEEDAELVLVESKTGNILTVQRGFNGTTPKAWDAETWIYRAITAQDIQELQKRAGYIVYDLTADELTAMDTAARAALYADGARVLKVTNGETVVLLTLNAEGATQWAGGEMPRNLLDNSDFTNPVNQRGKTSYTAAGYTIDRWKTATAGTVTLADNGISVNASSAAITLRQHLDRVADGVYTAAVKANDSVYTRVVRVENKTVSTVNNTNAGFEENKGYISCELNSGYVSVGLVTTANNNNIFEWAALYEGSYTADTLPPYVPKGYGAELAECQRYALKCTNVIDTCLVYGNGANVVFTPKYYSQMRGNPTCTISSITWIRGNGVNITNAAAQSVAPYSTNSSNPSFAITLAEALTVGNLECMTILSNYMLSADL